MKKWTAWMLLLAALLFGSVFGFYHFKQQMIAQFMAQRSIPAAPVEVFTAQGKDWRPAIESIGFIEPEQGVTLSSSVAGLVKAIHFTSGQKVQANQLLVSLDAEVEKANLASAEARLPAMERQLQRNRTLLAKGSVSQTQFDDSEADYLALVSDIASLKATIARREIRAPFSGVMGIRQVNLGQYLQPGEAIARLENIDQMLLRFIVPQKDMAKLRIGSELEINTDAYPEQRFSGEVVAIEPTVEANSGVVQVQATIPNAEQLLRSGMYTSVRLWQDILPQQVVIPQQAVIFTLYGESLYVVEEQQNAEGETVLIAQQRNVELSERRGDEVVVASGLAAGEQVVLSGQVRLRNGASVRVVEDSFLQRDQALPRD